MATPSNGALRKFYKELADTIGAFLRKEKRTLRYNSVVEVQSGGVSVRIELDTAGGTEIIEIDREFSDGVVRQRRLVLPPGFDDLEPYIQRASLEKYAEWKLRGLSVDGLGEIVLDDELQLSLLRRALDQSGRGSKLYVRDYDQSINEQTREQVLENNSRPRVEMEAIVRVDRDEQKDRAEVAEEERIARMRLPETAPNNPVTKKSARKTVLDQEKENDVHRAAFIAARKAFLAGGTVLGVEAAISKAIAASAVGMTAKEKAQAHVAIIPLVLLAFFFPSGEGRKQTDNERMREEFIRHQIYVMRYAGDLQKTVLELLNGAEKDLKNLLERRTGRFAGRDYDAETERRIKKLMREVRELRNKVHDKVYEKWRDDLKDLSVREGRYMNNASQAISPVQLDLNMPRDSTLRALVDDHPFQGRVLREWASDLRRKDIDRIETQIRQGMIQGETSQQIARRIVGSTSARGGNGVTEITRRDAIAITRTAVNSIANRSRQEVLDANRDVFTWELYVATLDARTTPLCRGLDGKRYKHGEGPQPPVHFQCRSVRVALFTEKAIGSRPMKPITEQRLLREYNEKAGTNARTREALPRGHKSAFDEFARSRVRATTGTTPAATNYNDFLRAQPAWFQEDILGVRKAKLFRDGGLTLDKFVDRKGREYTLAELARRERQAFYRAGYDPDDFD